MTVETKTWSALLMEAVERNFEEAWKEKYGENYPALFDVRIAFVPEKVVKISDRYETKEHLMIDDHFERVAGYSDLYVMNLEDDK